LDIVEEKLEEDSRVFKMNLIPLDNAIVIFLFEEQMRLGTVAIAMPGTGEVVGGRSSVLVGGKYMMCARVLAEKLAAKSGKIAVVSLFTELDEPEALRTYVRLLDKASVVSQGECKNDVIQ
jgi:hypothetical protein